MNENNRKEPLPTSRQASPAGDTDTGMQGNAAQDTDPKATKSAPPPGGRGRTDVGAAYSYFEGKSAPPPPKKSGKKSWLGKIFLLAVIAFGVVMMVQLGSSMSEEQKSLGEVLSQLDPLFGSLTLLAILLILFIDAAKYFIALSATTKRPHPLISLKVALLGRYYDNVTPFATGGQPMQIYYLHKKGFSGGLSAAVVFIKYAFNTCAWLFVAAVAMIFGGSALSSVSTGGFLKVAGWIGWCVNALVPLFIFGFIIFPTFSQKLTEWLIRAGVKLRIVKNKEHALNRAYDVVRDFRSSFAIMAHHPFEFVLLSLSCIVELSLTFALPFFIMKAFGGLGAEAGFAVLVEVMALNAYATFASSVVPTPGNSGAIESTVTMAFSYIASSILIWVVIFWRFSTYYLYILIGVGITVYDFIASFLQKKRQMPNLKDSAATVPGERHSPDERADT